MAVAITKPSSQIGLTTNLSIYSMAPTFLPSASSKIVVAGHASGTLTGSISGNGAPAWTLISSMNARGGGNSSRLWRGEINGAPASLSINMDYTGDAATGCCAAAVEITGAQSGVLQSVTVNSVGANPVVTFTNSVILGSGVVVALCLVGATGIVTPPSGWTTIAASYGTPTTGLVLAYANSMSAQTYTFSTGALTALAYMAAEFAALAEGGAVNIAPFLMMRKLRMNA